MTPPIHDAVTVVLQHGDQIYLTRRQPYLKAFPGYHTFPGGKVDKTDSDVAYAEGPLAAHPARLMHALVRELREELDYDLEQAIADGAVLALSELGRALTPPTQTYRYDTHFFLLRLRELPSIRLDANEAAEGEWATPMEWIARYESGELLAAPPTRICVAALAVGGDVLEIPGLFRAFDPKRLMRLESVQGVRQLAVPSHTVPPADTTNCFLLGDDDAHRILVDPSPKSLDVFEQLCVQAGEIGFHEVFLTHHHPDHREFANELARRFKVPIGMSADTHARISKMTDGRYFAGPGWFDGLEVKLYRDGDIVTQWLGQPVRALEVPGHDEGQLALMPDSKAWCIVGDLIQGIGTVVIARPEGNMGRYFASLQRIIDLKPRVIFPSHGIGMGTTFRLEETLRHRQQREAQVLGMHREGKTIDQMLSAIYTDVDPRLLPLARMNIEGHLDKLREEGAVTP